MGNESFKNQKQEFRNILIVRTDRMGDVVLTVPSIRALRRGFPSARITFMLAPDTRELVEGNPYLNDVIVYDKKRAHRGFLGTIRFVRELRRRKFDLAVIFHTKQRTNLICFLARIPVRIGYRNEKWGFFLNRPLKDTRPQGLMHEASYCLDVVRQLGVEVSPGPEFFVPVRQEAEAWMEGFLREHRLRRDANMVVIHPGASCISKRWPAEKFGEFIDKIQTRYVIQVVMIGTNEIRSIADKILAGRRRPIIDMVGKTSVSQLVSLVRRCRVMISNDSGPMHLASALGVPVIALFGRNQAGLNPDRWRPLEPRSIVLHKDVGCVECTAHECEYEFKCLEAISPEEVFEAFDAISRLW